MSASGGCRRVVVALFVASALLAGAAAYWLYDRYTRRLYDVIPIESSSE